MNLSPLNRAPYFWWGSGLMAVKYNVDRLIAWNWFHRTWYFWNYIKPHASVAIDDLPPEDSRFYLVLLVTSLPFLFAGIYFTVRRLRSVGLSLVLCVLFFVPVINLIFFVGLCVLPARWREKSPQSSGLKSWLPRSAAGSAALSAGVVGGAGASLALLGTDFLQNYGWGLFVSLPFVMGLVSVLLYAGAEPRSLQSCLGVALLPLAIAGVCLLVAAAEGAICLIMAAPIAALLALLGGFVGYLIVGKRSAPLGPGAALALLVSVPFTMGMEKQAGERPPLFAVTSSIVINAPPDQVWPNVVSFPVIPPERDWVLHTGIAYPTNARIDGSGVGAIRHCVFTTGEFVEPIEVWDENRLLRFSVAKQPQPMEELSPYPHLKTTHLDGYFLSHEGELRLTALPGGKTLLEGTTWYTDEIWPSAYWRLWSDMIIHHIHLRVLHHIKNLSERHSSISGDHA